MPSRPHFPVILLVAFVTLSSGSSDVSTKSLSADLSYNPFTTADATRLTLTDQNILSLDITGSMLGDEEFSSLCSAVELATLLQIRAQMNRLSAKAAVQLFEKLLGKKKNGGDELAEMRRHRLLSLDLGFNPLLIGVSNGALSATSAKEQKRFCAALRTLVGSKESCPKELYFECTGIDASTCRSLAKGIIARYSLAKDKESPQDAPAAETEDPLVDPISLHLSNNPGIGDAGVVAIAAALRTVLRANPGATILETLDLSKCSVDDAGAEALAMVLDDEAGKLAIRHLIVGQNHIGNRGLLALCRAFPPETIVFDGNDLVTDTGMTGVAEMISTGKTAMKLSLRSCNLKASGVERIGTALRHLFSKDLQTEINLELDLSGNPLGVLRGKAKGDSKYSASRIKSTVSATASAYMNQGMSILKKGFGSTMESDDEEEMRDDELSEEDEDNVDQDRCGLKALANAFIFEDGEDDAHSKVVDCSSEPRKLILGLRRTFCDTSGAEALAAMLVTAKERFNTNLKLDLALNPVLEEEMIDALHGYNDDLLHDMSERHLESMEVLRRAKQRAALAAKVTAARLRRQDDLEADWGSVGDVVDLHSDHSDIEQIYQDEMESQSSDYYS